MSASPATIVALGAGRMGQGLAHVFAYAGHQVTLVDLKDRAASEFATTAENAIAAIRSNLRDCFRQHDGKRQLAIGGQAISVKGAHAFD